MALSAVYTAMHLEEPKHVHPFFSKTSNEKALEPDAAKPTLRHDGLNEDQDYTGQDTNPQTAKPRKKRPRRTAQTKNQPSLDSFARRPAAKSNDQDAEANPDDVAGPSLEEDLNLDRRKRRKTASPTPLAGAIHEGHNVEGAPLNLHHQLQAEADREGTQDITHTVLGEDALVANTPEDDTPASSLPVVADAIHEDLIPESSLPEATKTGSRSATPTKAAQDTATGLDAPMASDTVAQATNNITQKKQIKVTKTGKLVSSPPKPPPPTLTTPKKRGRPRKAAKKANLSATITIIRYGSGSESREALGRRIEDILRGSKSLDKPPTAVPPKPTGPPKAPHPFFTGKAGQKKEEVSTKSETACPPITSRTTACTPGKLRAERRKEQDDEFMPAFGMASKNSRLAKQSGLFEPAWPSKTTSHVRNLNDEGLVWPSKGAPASQPMLRPAKLKSNSFVLPAEEEVITALAQQLSASLHKTTNHTKLDFAPPEEVRLPNRILTTGIEIQHKVRAQIRTPLDTLSSRLFAKTHPAISTLFDDIEHTLTPFDEGRCETQAWAQKYRPERADRVLQSGKEAHTLKDWLKNLTVMAVGAVQDPLKPNTSLDAKKPPKKKRRTTVDDFIISDDEDEDEDEEMIEVTRSESANPRLHPSIRLPRWTRNKNVVLISGPHGCGKSATVYAVAKELDFEVFELHSGVRRSGRDIQDKVGDMTANHLVNHKREGLPAKVKPVAILADDNTDNERDQEFQKDLDSGRQGTMTSFFTTNPAAKSKPKEKPPVKVVPNSPAKVRAIPAAQAMLPITASRKSQKQSLILIEEADVLFEEDQSFWAQVIKLAAQSKRPIVITCNDELQIPTQALPMAAVLRLDAPPVDLATDYLVALAGREGHIVQRQAITDLYESKSHDLRASITELNFWCQMSVGDKKGGLEWMYQRWPPGKDVDANGRLLRVASEDTYQSGMGWLSHNVISTASNVAFDKEEELLKEVWNDWGISPTLWSAGDRTNHTPVASHKDDRITQLDELDRLVEFSDALSALDIHSRIDLPSYDSLYDRPVDPTLPPISKKERLSYTIAAPILDANSYTDYLDLSTLLTTQTHILCHRLFPDLAHTPSQHSNKTLSTHYTGLILADKKNPPAKPLPRTSFSTAFDILATPSTTDLYTGQSFPLTSSSFDRNLRILTTDLAPYIRSIVAHEQMLETQRIRLGSLLSEGGTKRARTTRASRTAMEGGERRAKRRERWFDRDLNFELVMRTAGRSWAGLGWRREGDEDASLTGTQNSASLGGFQNGGDGLERDVMLETPAE